MAFDRSSGFTLLELLVVLAILALLVALVPRLSRHNPGLSVRATATSLAADLRMLRNDAARRREVATLILSNHSYALSPSRVTRDTSPEVLLSYVATGPDFLGKAVDQLKFFSDGSSSGGTVLVRDGQSQAAVEVNWLDGSIFVHAQ